MKIAPNTVKVLSCKHRELVLNIRLVADRRHVTACLLNESDRKRSRQSSKIFDLCLVHTVIIVSAAVTSTPSEAQSFLVLKTLFFSVYSSACPTTCRSSSSMVDTGSKIRWPTTTGYRRRRLSLGPPNQWRGTSPRLRRRQPRRPLLPSRSKRTTKTVQSSAVTCAQRRLICNVCWIDTWSATATSNVICVRSAAKDSTTRLTWNDTPEHIRVRAV